MGLAAPWYFAAGSLRLDFAAKISVGEKINNELKNRPTPIFKLFL